MKKKLTSNRMAMYLFALCMVCVLVLGTTYARYNQTITGTGTAQIAAVGVELVKTNDLGTTLDLTSALSDLHPGVTVTIPFTVTNKSSDVVLDYTLSLSTTGNLPVTYTLEGNVAAKGKLVTIPDSTTDNSMVWSGGEMPYGAVTHSYTLTVVWPADINIPWYMNEIDAVKLTVDAVQRLPVAS